MRLNSQSILRCRKTGIETSEARKGAFLILALFCLVVTLIFVSLSVDIGFLGLAKTRMQNGVDAAALAAAQEITYAVQNAPQGTQDVTAYALGSARQKASDVAALNDVYVHPQTDVIFGRRSYNEATQKFTISWNQSPANVVKVIARRTESDVTAPDGKLQLFFAGWSGDNYAKVRTEAIAYVESRDIVVVHDFSRSMNFDSYFNEEGATTLSDVQIVSNLQLVWNDLQPLSAGTMTFQPQYLTLSKTDSGVTASATFKYDKLTATTNGTLQTIKLRYDNNSEQTFSGLSGTTTTVNGSRNISSAWITATPPSSAGAAITLNGDGMTLDVSANRKSVSVNAPYKLTKLRVVFTDGSTDTLNWGWDSGPSSTNYSSGKAIDYVRVYAPESYLHYFFGVNSYFDIPSNNGSGGSSSAITLQFDDTDSNVKDAFGLTGSYPFPYGSWDEFISHARNNSKIINKGYREMYGGLTFVNYILRSRSSHSETPALMNARHYPFHAIKEGHALLCDMLNTMQFADEIGMVSYDTNHRVEKILSETGCPSVDISDDPITNDYDAVTNLMRYKQANHYSQSTNMGGGLEDAIDLLDNKARPGARPTILLMTDGNTNAMDGNKSGDLPTGWDWDALFDYDNNGQSDYTTSSYQKRYVLKAAYDAYQKGYTVHTMSVGADADRDLMRAIAHLGGGTYIDIPAGYSVADMEEDVEAAFHKIATFVPPAKLLTDPDAN